MQQEKNIKITQKKETLFTCRKKYKFATLSPEMKKILFFTANLLACIGIANGAVRDGTATSRSSAGKQPAQNRINTTSRPMVITARTLSPAPRPASSSHPTGKRQQSTRSTQTTREKKNNVSVIPRAASDNTFSMSETRTGAEYEQCKNTYFACMDQFCQLKNDDYRRCSCNDRVFKLTEARKTLTDAGEQLTIFTENLDVVGMTAGEATSMRSESAGETALTGDSSASKALLQAIMNSIRGTDSNVSGRYSDLNSINISFDTTNAFGSTDSGQLIATYNGAALYSAVYPQCRNAVRNDCNTASLQRAVTAYLMAIEQDCNTVQTAIETTQKNLKSAIREGSAMLDLARIENRKKHNSSDITTCINEVEAAILSEEVCGANYHKCLDNGEFIDIATGKPIIGVEDFYKLEQLLSFSSGVDAADQKLAHNQKNRPFVTNFEKRVKKFASDALNKCVENADTVWSEYLDKAMLSIYYAQRNKVAEIKQGCFEFISACYESGNNAIDTALSKISKDNAIILQPDKIILNHKTCTDYINSCNGMFADNIIQDYVENMQQTDLKTACRAVVRQCFDRYGGTNYENFYYPYSGLFATGMALKWFTLTESECAKQLESVPACNTTEIIKDVFGGFVQNGDSATPTLQPTGVATEIYNQIISILTTQCTNVQGRFVEKAQIKTTLYDQNNPCISKFHTDGGVYKHLTQPYNIGDGENMCPRDYALSVDTQSWGACLCWENGARRSKWGKSAKCVSALPVSTEANDAPCSAQHTLPQATITSDFSESMWCTQGSDNITDKNQVCPLGATVDDENGCIINGGESIPNIPEGIK